MNLNKDLQVAGYVMIPRALLLRAFEENREAVGDMNAFLRVLTYVNYAEGMTKCCNIEVACRRGESVISFSSYFFSVVCLMPFLEYVTVILLIYCPS